MPIFMLESACTVATRAQHETHRLIRRLLAFWATSTISAQRPSRARACRAAAIKKAGRGTCSVARINGHWQRTECNSLGSPHPIICFGCMHRCCIYQWLTCHSTCAVVVMHACHRCRCAPQLTACQSPSQQARTCETRPIEKTNPLVSRCMVRSSL